MHKSGKSIVNHDTLLFEGTRIQVGSPEWFEWLSWQSKFWYQGDSGHFTAQCELRRNRPFWYAYRRRSGKLYKHYLGKPDELTAKRLEYASGLLAGGNLFNQYASQPTKEQIDRSEARIDRSFLPQVKVTNPALPHSLLTRPRLLRQIRTPLTIISAPSGFGKSTLLNDWKRSCGFAVAWLSLDESDNHLMRFWHAIAAALQTLHPDFGAELLNYLHNTAQLHPQEIRSHLTNDINNTLGDIPRFGLVLDNFHHITLTEIYTSLQAWLEYFPTNMQLIILGHAKPALSIGHLRAQGLVTELDASDLRFSIEEGVRYLRQTTQEPSVAYPELEKLVNHAEGWAAGLTLTAIALGKQGDPHHFINTFSGAHIYLREYFTETVLQHASPEVQAFLLKTSILKHLTGSLCDAVTGQASGEEMLEQLWFENIFIERLEQPGWYRYHDLFAEMLLSQVQSRFPSEIPLLHKRAALWYREQNAPADAVYHLLAMDAWEDAASLIQSMAFRELEQYGEDSRLLRWLQELPEEVVQKHKTLLFVYLRLAEVALPKQHISRFIAQIEENLSKRPVSHQAQDEREMLEEIRRIRHAWKVGDLSPTPARIGDGSSAKWEVLNGLQLLKQENIANQDLWENQLVNLLDKARAQGNLFVILMAGGVLARSALVNGHLRRSEKIARQVLEQALLQRGSLPEPASIALTVLSQVCLERHELEPAQRYLAQAQEVDPNPTSTNMLVQNAIQRAKIQAAAGKYDEALTTIKAIRDLHTQRPSGMWTDQDLLAYEALFHLRKGDVSAAERLLNESTNSEGHRLSLLVRAGVWIANGPVEAAEALVENLVERGLNSISYEPMLAARVLLALAAFKQHKNHQAFQITMDAVRLAAPERFYRPFLESGEALFPLLVLAQKAGKQTRDVQIFLKELFRIAGYTSSESPAETEALSTSTSISQREQDVLQLLSGGDSNTQLAAKLCISESTVKTHLRNIFQKLGVNNRVQAVKSAKELNLIQ